MHILFLTWKDIKHPNKGGAEVVMYRYMDFLVRSGHDVTWFASGFPGGAPEEMHDGIRIIRKYSIYTIYFLAWWWYLGFRKNHKIDCIIDEAGGIPLMSSAYEFRIPILFFIHHIGNKEWRDKFPEPIATMWKTIFSIVLWLYRKKVTVTVSDSTRQELISRGFLRDRVHVIDNAIELRAIPEIDFSIKEKYFLFVGRLTSIKRAEDAILAFNEIKDELPEYTLKIVGQKQELPHVEMLEHLIQKHSLQDRVELTGDVSDEARNDYFKKAAILLVPSRKEGFGLVVLEANAMGTPVIGYEVPGLRDVIKNDKNGYLITDGDYHMMAKTMLELIQNPEKLTTISLSSLEHARTLPTWDDQAKKFLDILTSKIH